MYWTASSRPLLPFEHEGRRLGILVEGISSVRESALRVGAVVELHGDVEHHEIRGGHTSARPRLKQSARRGVRPGRPCRELPCQSSGGRSELILGHHMRGYPNLTGFASGNRLAKHGESRCPSATGALRNPLQGSGDREHCSRDFHATEGGVLRRNEKIARQRKLEAAAECDALHHRYCRYLQHFDSTIRDVHLRDERSEPVDVLAWPFAHFAAEAEVRPLRANDKHTYVAFAGLTHCDPQSLRKSQIESVERRVGQHDTSDSAGSFKSNRRHCDTSSLCRRQAGR